MSDQTRETLEKAVKDHYRDETGGAFMTDFVIGIAGVSAEEDGLTEYMYGSSDSPYHSLKGLASMVEDNFADEENYE